MNLLDCIKKEIDRVYEELYSDHTSDCKPVFIASLYGKTLIITCEHNGLAFSDKLFPENDMTYGLNSIEAIMNDLYNKTM